MPGSCCARPITTIINIDGIETGLMGLETILSNAYLFDIKDENELKEEMLRWTKEFGNYVSKSREDVYKEALLREYNIYKNLKAKEEEIKKQNENPKVLKTKKRRWFRI